MNTEKRVFEFSDDMVGDMQRIGLAHISEWCIKRVYELVAKSDATGEPTTEETNELVREMRRRLNVIREFSDRMYAKLGIKPPHARGLASDYISSLQEFAASESADRATEAAN